MPPPLRGSRRVPSLRQWRIGPALAVRKRRFAFPEHHGPSADNDESGIACACLNARQLGGLGRGHAGEQPAKSEMRRRSDAVVGHCAAQFKPAGQLLGMLAFDAGARREIGRAARDQVKLLG